MQPSQKERLLGEMLQSARGHDALITSVLDVIDVGKQNQAKLKLAREMQPSLEQL